MSTPINLHRALVPVEVPPTSGPYGPWVTALGEFYKRKNIADNKAGVFSCEAAGQFPHGWHAAFESGIWNEPGEYGDNFRAFFGLKKE